MPRLSKQEIKELVADTLGDVLKLGEVRKRARKRRDRKRRKKMKNIFTKSSKGP